MLLDLVVAGTLGYLLLGRVSEPRTLWLLRGYLLLVALGWLLQRYVNLPLTAQLIEALVLVCGLALAILLQGELRRLLELLGTGHLATLLGSRTQDPQDSGTVDILVDTTAQLSKRRCGGLIVLDLGSDLRPEDFLNPGVAIDAMLSVDLMLNLFSADSPLHDGAVLIQANRVASAGVILPLSRQTSFTRHGTRHLAALGLTERHDRCLCVVVSEESGTISMASQGRFERPITRERLRELLNEAVSSQGSARRRQPRTLTKSSSGGERAEATARNRP
ncbi:MAG: diadenylate cyclase CdaA [Synechococcus sp.]|nr:diadenylate cyclase CdaA [Synechococcus sp.]